MKTRTRDPFPAVREIIAIAAAHAEQEDWSLRQTIDWIQVQLGSVDSTAADALQSILDTTEEVESNDTAQEEWDDDRDEWEGRNNG